MSATVTANLPCAACSELIPVQVELILCANTTTEPGVGLVLDVKTKPLDALAAVSAHYDAKHPAQKAPA